MSEREIVCEDLNLAIDDLRQRGYRLDAIYPADDPRVAVLSGGDEVVRIAMPDAPPLLDVLPRFEPEFILTTAGASPALGRAGMLYRDLIPGRLGGRYIASHITMPEGGPVADWIHYHRVALQMIYVRRGWVRVVYEDQGEPFVMSQGDLVLQPPGIRHRVLESSPGLEVIEISAPALHETLADHDLELPGGDQPARRYNGQMFVRHVAAGTPWKAFNGAEAQETRVSEATDGLAGARTIRPGGASAISISPHQGELVFGFVLDGSACLEHRGSFEIGPGDAFAIPPGDAWRLSEMSRDFQLLHVVTARLDHKMVGADEAQLRSS